MSSNPYSSPYPFGFLGGIERFTFEPDQIYQSDPTSDYWQTPNHDPQRRWVRPRKVAISEFQESKHHDRHTAVIRPPRVCPPPDPSLTPTVEWFIDRLRDLVGCSIKGSMGNKVTPSGMESMDEQLEKLHARIAKLQQNNADLRKLRDDYRRTFAAWAEVDEPTGLPRLEAMRCDNVALKQQVEVLAGSFDRQGVTVQNLKRDIETYQASLHRANAFSVDMKDMLHRVAFFLHTLFTARLDNVGYEERAKKLCELYERLPHPFEVQEIDPRNVTETVREIERGSWMAEQHSGLPTQTSVDMFSNSSETNEATGGGQPIIDLRHNDGHGDNTGSSQANIIDHSIARTNLVIPGVPVPTMATPASLRAPVANMTGTGSSTSNGGPRRTYSWLGNNNHTAPDWLSTGASRATNVRGNNAVTPANGVVPHGEAIPPPEVVVIEDDDEQGPPAAAADIIMAEAEEDTTIDDLFNAEWDNY